MPVDHYENFPVASFLMPANLRPAVEAIYAFARSADDLADEGDASSVSRLSSLASYEAGLARIRNGEPSDSPLFTKLAQIIPAYQLPLQPFFDLLSAFKQDVVTTRYSSFEKLMDYCRRSANPVGALMLHLYGVVSPEHMRASDAICSALQLINFWQDVAIDWRKGRIYLPQEDMQRFAVNEADLDAMRADKPWQALMAFQVNRARKLLLSGAPLARSLPGRIGWELRLVVQGGLRILEHLENVHFDVFRQRPQLRTFDWLIMGKRALCDYPTLSA